MDNDGTDERTLLASGFAWFHFTDNSPPLFEFNTDFSQITVTYTAVWGHGSVMTMDGQYVLMDWWENGHNKFRVWDFDLRAPAPRGCASHVVRRSRTMAGVRRYPRVVFVTGMSPITACAIR